jgi:hypothetical protein
VMGEEKEEWKEARMISWKVGSCGCADWDYTGKWGRWRWAKWATHRVRIRVSQVKQALHLRRLRLRRQSSRSSSNDKWQMPMSADHLHIITHPVIPQFRHPAERRGRHAHRPPRLSHGLAPARGGVEGGGAMREERGRIGEVALHRELNFTLTRGRSSRSRLRRRR